MAITRKFYNKEQLKQLDLGMADYLDITYYANKKMNWRQMVQIRLGMMDKIDISLYNNVKINWRKMHEIRMGLIKNVNISIYSDYEKYSASQMKQLRLGLEDKLDVTRYWDPKISGKEMLRKRIKLQHMGEC